MRGIGGRQYGASEDIETFHGKQRISQAVNDNLGLEDTRSV
jgi:hypothetical protein